MTSVLPSDTAGQSAPPHGLEYFHAPPGAITAGTVHIEGEEYAHLTHVMRRREGDIIGVMDGEGTAYLVLLTALQKRAALGSIQATYPMLHEHPTPVTLAAAVLKNPSRFDYMIEKLTEAGIRTFIPLFTERTIPRHARTERWQKIALAAAKQCGRCIVPRIQTPASIGEFLEGSGHHGSHRWILHEEATADMPVQSGEVEPGGHSIIIGPEGGFSTEEVALAVRHGYSAVSVGPRRLRSETAALAAALRVLL